MNIGWTLFGLSLCVNLVLLYEVDRQSSVIKSIAEKPSELENAFAGTVVFSANDSVTGRPVEKLEWVGADMGGGKRNGVSSAFDREGRLVLFGYGSKPFDVEVGAPGYKPYTFMFSERTVRESGPIKIELVPLVP